MQESVLAGCGARRNTREMPNASPHRVALFTSLLLAPALAHAEGEYGPLFGGSIMATHGTERDVAGVGAELAFWYSRIGIGVEASEQWTVDEQGPRVGALAGSLRVLVFDHIVPSVLDSREVVDLGIELHGIVERTWWNDARVGDEPVRYGLGIALRLRGVNDDDRSTLLAESRFFVRVLKARTADSNVAARETMPSMVTEGATVIIGLGALFGGGRPAYVQQLRRRNTLDAEAVVR